MSIKEIAEVLVILVGVGATLVGALSNVLSGTITVKRAKLTGDLMEQTINIKSKENQDLLTRVGALEGKLTDTTKKCDDLERQVIVMSAQKAIDAKAVETLTALARSYGATDAQLKLAAAGILVTKAELEADPELDKAVNKLVAHAAPTLISEGK